MAAFLPARRRRYGSRDGLSEVRIRTRGKLPHWEKKGSTYFVTFRLAGSLPREVVAAARAGVRNAAEINCRARSEVQRKAVRPMEAYLDRGSGVSHLRNPRVASMVGAALRRFDGTRYELNAWCVMPNHVHVVFRPLGQWGLARIVHSWKSFTAKRAMDVLGLEPPFWQREYYDRLIRSGEELTRAVRYVVENPARAGLKDWQWAEMHTRL